MELAYTHAGPALQASRCASQQLQSLLHSHNIVGVPDMCWSGLPAWSLPGAHCCWLPCCCRASYPMPHGGTHLSTYCQRTRCPAQSKNSRSATKSRPPSCPCTWACEQMCCPRWAVLRCPVACCLAGLHTSAVLQVHGFWVVKCHSACLRDPRAGVQADMLSWGGLCMGFVLGRRCMFWCTGDHCNPGQRQTAWEFPPGFAQLTASRTLPAGHRGAPHHS